MHTALRYVLTITLASPPASALLSTRFEPARSDLRCRSVLGRPATISARPTPVLAPAPSWRYAVCPRSRPARRAITQRRPTMPVSADRGELDLSKSLWGFRTSPALQ